MSRRRSAVAAAASCRTTTRTLPARGSLVPDKSDGRPLANFPDMATWRNGCTEQPRPSVESCAEIRHAQPDLRNPDDAQRASRAHREPLRELRTPGVHVVSIVDEKHRMAQAAQPRR